MPAYADPVSDFISQHHILIPVVLSSSGLGFVVALKRSCGALKKIILAGLSGAAELHQALRRAVLAGEIGLLVVAGTVTSFVNRFSKQPRRTEFVVEGDHRRHSSRLI